MVKKGSKFKKYSKELKLEVVQAYFNGKCGGYEAVAGKFGLDSKYLVRDWVKLYKNKGSESFMMETRGRNSTGRPKSIKLEEMSLEEQNQYLRMENDILKKVQALLKD